MTRRTRNVTVQCSVYAADDGRVAFLDTPDGVIPPPRIDRMTYLGEVPSVITMAVNALGRPQGQFAALFGTHQQCVSRWVNAQEAPRLSDEQWATIIRLITTPSATPLPPTHPGR